MVRVRGWGPARRYVILGCVGLGSCGRFRVLVHVLVLVLVLVFCRVGRGGLVATHLRRPTQTWRDPPRLGATHPVLYTVLYIVLYIVLYTVQYTVQCTVQSLIQLVKNIILTWITF